MSERRTAPMTAWEFYEVYDGDTDWECRNCVSDFAQAYHEYRDENASCSSCEDWKKNYLVSNRERAAAQAENERLRADLKRYGKHDFICQTNLRPPAPCSCGFSVAALRSVEKGKEG